MPEQRSEFQLEASVPLLTEVFCEFPEQTRKPHFQAGRWTRHSNSKLLTAKLFYCQPCEQIAPSLFHP